MTTERTELVAEIDAARDELANSIEALVTRLDPKAGLHRQISHVGQRIGEGYQHAKSEAPEPVGRALDELERQGRPVAQLAARNPRRSFLVGAGTGLLVVVLLRSVRS
jgi:hypothetical protein